LASNSKTVQAVALFCYTFVLCCLLLTPDENECNSKPPPCANADCENEVGSYHCACHAGFTNNGTHCIGMHALSQVAKVGLCFRPTCNIIWVPRNVVPVLYLYAKVKILLLHPQVQL